MRELETTQKLVFQKVANLFVLMFACACLVRFQMTVDFPHV